MIKIIYAMINHRQEEGFEDNLVFLPGEYEIMIFQVPVLIEVNGTMDTYPENTCVLYKPGQRIHYRAVSGELVYNWIRFDCDEPLYTEYFLPYGIPVLCPDYDCYMVYWKAIANENYWQYYSASYVNEQLMHIIFHRLHDYAISDGTFIYRDAFIQLRDMIYAQPQHPWSLEEMASHVNLSTRSLQKFYKTLFHITPMNEVINSRITWAKFLLSSTSNSILQISEQCGYNNIEHFCRQFKKNEGLSPSVYRKQMEASSTSE